MESVPQAQWMRAVGLMDPGRGLDDRDGCVIATGR